MNLSRIVGWLLPLENVLAIDHIELALSAPWAADAPAWLFFGCLGLTAFALWFYYQYQPLAVGNLRWLLSICRSLLLCLLLLILADPVLTVHMSGNPRPLVYVLFDGTDSMAIHDDLTPAEETRLVNAVGAEKSRAEALPSDRSPDAPTTRADYVKLMLENPRDNVLQTLNKRFRLRAFIMDQADRVRALKLAAAGSGFDPMFLAEQLSTTGQVTALGASLKDLADRHASSQLGGVILISDFAQNAGPSPVQSDSSPVHRLGVPVFAVGLGPESAVDLAVSIRARPLMKKAERDNVRVTIKQTQLTGKTVTVRVASRPIGAGLEYSDVGNLPEWKTTDQELNLTTGYRLIGQKTIQLDDSPTHVSIPFTPEDTGRFALVADVRPLEEEAIQQNNRAVREVSVRDDFLRLMYVEYEPTWEWRFIKEVFFRDKLVGTRGFRTYLRSSDPKVRHTQESFMPSLVPPRSEFFATDVVFLGDVPEEMLTPRFCDMTKEFVSRFGGGLVVLSGPRFGPNQLVHTPLADMLPVLLDPDLRLRDRQSFRLRLSPAAEQFEFMQFGVGASDGDSFGRSARPLYARENQKLWNNLGALPWYQPVVRMHPLATTLAAHPTDMCVDGTTPQPLIAIRNYGKGQVVFLAFNETWRLRRKHGERYYREFWGQLIYHLGLRHALGSQKRFVVRTDRSQYQADDLVTLTVEAYDANFNPLSSTQPLEGQLIEPLRGINEYQQVKVPLARDGVYESRIPVFAGGEHQIRVRDPITGEYAQAEFQVTELSAERRSAVRNASLQQAIATISGGRAYDLAAFCEQADQIQLPAVTETSIKVFSLWSTWLVFLLTMLLMFFEWFARKSINLP